MTTAYRPDIDGLRALAVLSVVLFHVEAPGFGGGFVGVDIFFVISGFLITSIIVKEIEAGHFSLLNFYERRIRRIIPALSVMVFACLIAGFFLMTPGDYEALGRNALAAMLFHSNIWLADEAGYFMPAAATLPLLHTWSLGVEEQFYVLAPLLLMALWRVGSAWRRAGLFAVAFALALLTSIVLTDHDKDKAFYLLQTRAFELMIGAALVWNVVPQIRSRVGREAATLAGLLGCGLAITMFNADLMFPGPAALAPCLGAALIIHAGRPDGKSPIAAALLANPLATFIGRISYSLYLWHWPILIFAAYAAPSTLGVAERVAVVAASLLVSTISYYLVETPVRQSDGFFSAKRAFIGGAATIFTLCVVAATIIRTDGWPARLPSGALMYLKRIQSEATDKGACTPITGGGVVRRKSSACRLGSDRDPQFLVWGDSHAGSLSTIFARAGLGANKSGYLIVRGGCGPFLSASVAKALLKRKCIETSNFAIEALRQHPSIKTVILVARWNYYPESGAPAESRSRVLEAGLTETVRTVVAMGRRVVIFGPIPEPEFDVLTALLKAKMYGRPSDYSAKSTWFLHDQNRIDAILARARDNGAIVVEPHSILCERSRCPMTADGLPLYSDDNHLNGLGAARLQPLVNQVLREPSQ